MMHRGNTKEGDDSAFMEELLSGIDASFFDADLSSPDRPSAVHGGNLNTGSRYTSLLKTPTKTRGPKEASRSPYARKCAPLEHLPSLHQEDVGDLLVGAEDWDWDDMNSDFMTPQKNKKVVNLVRYNLYISIKAHIP